MSLSSKSTQDLNTFKAILCWKQRGNAGRKIVQEILFRGLLLFFAAIYEVIALTTYLATEVDARPDHSNGNLMAMIWWQCTFSNWKITAHSRVWLYSKNKFERSTEKASGFSFRHGSLNTGFIHFVLSNPVTLEATMLNSVRLFQHCAMDI